MTDNYWIHGCEPMDHLKVVYEGVAVRIVGRLDAEVLQKILERMTFCIEADGGSVMLLDEVVVTAERMPTVAVATAAAPTVN